jgi:hypothetical protein
MDEGLRIGGLEVKRVKLSVEVEPELRRRVKIAAASKDQPIREWIVGAIRHELENEVEEDELILPPAGVKPQGLREGAPKLRSGATLSEAVIEDRR